MKTLRKLLPIALALALVTASILQVLAAGTLTKEDALAGKGWQAIHRWDFNGNLTDSVGGATVSPVDVAYFQEPTYEDGKIKLTGHSVYTFDEALNLNATDGLQGLRIDVKGKLDFTVQQGSHRIFGMNTGSKMSGLNYINIAGAQYGGCSFALSTDSPAWGSFVLLPDQTKFDKTAENLYTFIFLDNYLYYYANGVLLASAANAQGGAFTFTDFLGCSYVTNAIQYNTVGVLDYIEISMFNAEAVETDTPETTPDETDPPVETENDWVGFHRWDFDGNLVDSIGGATVSPVDVSYFKEPTYENGKIKLTGHSVYTFDEALNLNSVDGYSGLRIDVKGKLDFNTTAGAHRIFGLNTGSKMAGLNYINIAGAQYGGCSFALSTDSSAWNSFVLLPDQTKFDKNAENLYTFIFQDNVLYYYANGELIATAANTQGGAFTFTDFLGCSYVTAPITNNTVGELDYIEISMFGPVKEAIPEPDIPVKEEGEWVGLHRWDFNGNLKDSIGGATVTKVAAQSTADPTYENGKIKLTGNTAYTFDNPLTFSFSDEMKYFRVDLKAVVDMTAYKAGHRLFGSNKDLSTTDVINDSNSGVYFYNLNMAQYGGAYGIALQTNSPATQSFILTPDLTKFDSTAENLFTLVYCDAHLYYYVNGVLVADAPNKQGGTFQFTDFLGCSYAKAHFAGTIDYVEISMFKVQEEPHQHDYKAVVTAPTCTAEGYTTYTCDCGDTYVGDKTAKLEHAYQSVVTAPTCTAEGYTTYTCEACGDRYVDNKVTVADHQYGEWQQTKAPTYTEQGEEKRECAHCDHVETRAIAVLEQPDTMPDDSDENGSADTGTMSLALPIMVLATAGVILVSRKKK